MTTREEEQKYWRKIIEELSREFTLQFIADHIGVGIRQVTNIRHGDRPTGLGAIRLVELHRKTFRVEQSSTLVPSGTMGHCFTTQKA